MDLLSVYIGDRLGYYRALRDAGPMTPGELAKRTETDERYAREWLEQQAVTSFLDVDDPVLPALARRYRLADGHLLLHVLPDQLGDVASLRERLERRGARVADVGCGVGWAAIGLARRYPGCGSTGSIPTSPRSRSRGSTQTSRASPTA